MKFARTIDKVPRLFFPLSLSLSLFTPLSSFNDYLDLSRRAGGAYEFRGVCGKGEIS